MCLNELSSGCRCRIDGFVAGMRSYRTYLVTLGLIPGAEFKLCHISKSYRLVLVRVNGEHFQLGADEASILKVSPF